ncbi:MAG: DUF2924 domain-containing protein [Rhizobiaceae bacterium]|nr:DUF2924 domain-containing protein [Rhizobiaceae bacterium]
MRRSRLDLDAGLSREVAALGDLSRDELADLWEKVHGHPPPKGMRQELLVRSASWHLQARRLGGLRPQTRRLLKAAIAEAEGTLIARRPPKHSGVHSHVMSESKADGGLPATVEQGNVDTEPRSSSPKRTSLLPGARLVRDWNGKTHVVDVIEGGFVFEARVHTSLTAIARQITGAHWSGPRFFGL